PSHPGRGRALARACAPPARSLAPRLQQLRQCLERGHLLRPCGPAGEAPAGASACRRVRTGPLDRASPTEPDRVSWRRHLLVPAALSVVAVGPYRWIRHPNYLALILEFAALPLVGGAYFCAVGLSVLNGALLWRRIWAEESLLDLHPDYRRQMAGKPRFIPRVCGLASGQKRHPVARR